MSVRSQVKVAHCTDFTLKTRLSCGQVRLDAGETRPVNILPVHPPVAIKTIPLINPPTSTASLVRENTVRNHLKLSLQLLFKLEN